MAEQTIIRYMWTTASTFDVFHELDNNYKVPNTIGIELDDAYRLIKVPVFGGKCDGEKTQWLLDGGTWGADEGKEYHAQIWSTEDNSCWPTLEAASKAVFQRALDHLSWSLSFMDQLFDVCGQCEGDLNKDTEHFGGKSYGETAAYLTARMASRFAHQQEIISDILLQHRRLWLQEHGGAK